MSGRLVGRVVRSRLGTKGGNWIAERLLLTVLAEELRDTRPGEFLTVGVRWLAERMECTPDTVLAAIDGLERLHVLRVRRPGEKRRNSYRIRWRLLAMPPIERQGRVGRMRTVLQRRTVAAPSKPVDPDTDGQPSVRRIGTDLFDGSGHEPVRNPSHPGADGEREPQQQPDPSDPGDEPPSPGPPHGPAATEAAAEDRARPPATAAATGRAPPSLQADLGGLLTLDPTQGDEMAHDGEAHEQISVTADGGPGPDGEEHRGIATELETAVLVGAVAGSTNGHPDGGDRGRSLYRGGDGVPWPAEPWDDEPVTVVRHVGLDAELVPLAEVLAKETAA